MMNAVLRVMVATALALVACVANAQNSFYMGIDAYKDKDAKVGPGVTLGLKFAPTLGAEIQYRTAKHE